MSAEMKLKAFIDKEIFKAYREKTSHFEEYSRELPTLFTQNTNRDYPEENMKDPKEKLSTLKETEESEIFIDQPKGGNLEKITEVYL